MDLAGEGCSIPLSLSFRWDLFSGDFCRTLVGSRSLLFLSFPCVTVFCISLLEEEEGKVIRGGRVKNLVLIES